MNGVLDDQLMQGEFVNAALVSSDRQVVQLAERAPACRMSTFSTVGRAAALTLWIGVEF